MDALWYGYGESLSTFFSIRSQEKKKTLLLEIVILIHAALLLLIWTWQACSVASSGLVIILTASCVG